MFRTDLLRELNAAKYKILGELEAAKNGMLQDMSGIDKCTLTKLRFMLSDFNTLENRVTEKVNYLEKIIHEYDPSTGEDMSKKIAEVIAQIEEIEEDVRNVSEETIFYVTPQAYGAVADGITDDSLAVAQAIAAASTKNGVVIFPKGEYMLHDITISNDIKLIGFEADILLPAQSEESNQFKNLFNSTSPIKFYMEGINVKGLGAALTTPPVPCSVLDFDSAKSIEIRKCSFCDLRVRDEDSNGKKDLGKFGIVAKVMNCDDFKFEENVITRTGGYEIMCIESSGFVNGEISYYSNHCIDLYGYSHNFSANTVNVDHNTFERFNTPASMFNLTGVHVACKNNTILDSMCSDIFDTSESGGCFAVDLVVENNYSTCISSILAIFRGETCRVANNYHVGKALFESCNVVVEHEHLPENWDCYIEDMKNVVIENNTGYLGVCSTDKTLITFEGMLYKLNRFGISVNNPFRYGSAFGRVNNCIIRGNVLDYSFAEAGELLNYGKNPIGLFANIDNCLIEGNNFINPLSAGRISAKGAAIVLTPVDEEHQFKNLTVTNNSINSLFSYWFLVANYNEHSDFSVSNGYVMCENLNFYNNRVNYPPNPNNEDVGQRFFGYDQNWNSGSYTDYVVNKVYGNFEYTTFMPKHNNLYNPYNVPN